MKGKQPVWNHHGKSASQRGYGTEHRKLRAQLFAQEPLCRMCQQKPKPRVTVATIADHTLSIAKGGAINSIENLQPLCFDCHQRKTLAEQGKRYRPRICVDGWPVDD